MRVCILGSSHIAAWKLGWERIRNHHAGLSLTFFGSRGLTLQELKVAGDRLSSDSAMVTRFMAMTSGGKTEIVGAEYDAFVVIALGFRSREALRIYRECRAESHKGVAGRLALVSDACFDAALLGLMRKTVAFNVVSKVREITDRPILLAPQPAMSDEILSGQSRWIALQEAIEVGDDRLLAESFGRISRAVENPQLKVLDQPAETMSSPMLTAAKFQVGAPHMDEIQEAREDDLMHMNGEYGVIAVQHMMNRLRNGSL